MVRQRGKRELIAGLLIHKGAEVSAKTRPGESVLYFTGEPGHRAGLKIRYSLDLDEAMMGALAKNTIGFWLNITGECSSAPLAGLHPALYQ